MKGLFKGIWKFKWVLLSIVGTFLFMIYGLPLIVNPENTALFAIVAIASTMPMFLWFAGTYERIGNWYKERNK